jgi:hypothetical protein
LCIIRDTSQRAWSQLKTHPILLSAIILLGCATGEDIVRIGDNAWRLTAIDNTQFEAARIGTNQAIEFCAKQGKAPFFAMVQTANDMPARHIATMEFQCTARGVSPEAQAEARMHGYQRDCAIAGFALGSPENIKCAAEVSAKVNPKASTGR